MSQMYTGPKVVYRYSCHISLEKDLSRQILEKSSNTEFHRNYCSGRQFVCVQTDGRTDRHDEANSYF